MHEALELMKGIDERQFALILLISRHQSRISAILENLQTSAEAGSSQAKDALFYYQEAEAALGTLIEGQRTTHHAKSSG
jgi:hypothetical protein